MPLARFSLWGLPAGVSDATGCYLRSTVGFCPKCGTAWFHCAIEGAPGWQAAPMICISCPPGYNAIPGEIIDALHALPPFPDEVVHNQFEIFLNYWEVLLTNS